MEFTQLGRTGLKVSRLCLGTMNFGPETSEPDAFQIMDRALELGINFFDTADVYGRKVGEGVTESIIGRWFAQGGRRGKVVLATKAYGQMSTEEWPNWSRLSKLHIIKACENSLKRMRTDYVDLHQMHHVAREAPWDEIWEAYETLMAQGKVVYAGSSNFAGWHIAKACETARRRNTLGLVSEQSLYNLTARMIELEVVPACLDYGLGIIPWSPLAGGLLGGALKKATEGRRASEGVQSRIEKERGKFEAWEGLCAELGEEPANVALAWLLAQPAVAAPIIGPRTVAQLDGAIRALEIILNPTTLERLDAIFPGPGGAAPEAYAW